MSFTMDAEVESFTVDAAVEKSYFVKGPFRCIYIKWRHNSGDSGETAAESFAGDTAVETFIRSSAAENFTGDTSAGNIAGNREFHRKLSCGEFHRTAVRSFMRDTQWGASPEPEML
ncbi:hypothetical protein Bca4012_020086 [Brassica carinata]